MRKLRTRQHIIEDLGFNHIERQVLYAGYIIQRYSHNDYSYDGIIHTFNENSEIEAFSMMVQLKSTDNLKLTKNKNSIIFDLSIRDLELWLGHTLPTIILLYDALLEKSYYMDVQAYFKENRMLLKNIHKFVRVYIPETNVFDKESVQYLRKILK